MSEDRELSAQDYIDSVVSRAADPLPTQEKVVAEHAAGQLDLDSEALTRDLDPEDKIERIPAEAKARLEEASKMLVPDMGESERRDHVSSLVDRYNESGEVDTRRFAQDLGKLGFKRQESEDAADPYLEAAIVELFPKLTDEQRREIKSQLPVVSEDEKREREREGEMTEEETKMNATINATGEEAIKTGEAIDRELEQKIKNPSISPETRTKLEEYRGRLNSLRGKVTDFFGPETPARNIARRVGKTLYFSLIGLFLIIILEMNMINKMTRRQR